MDIFGNLLKCLKLEMLQNISRISFGPTYYLNQLSMRSELFFLFLFVVFFKSFDKSLFQNCGKSGFNCMGDYHIIVLVEVHISNY